MSRNNPYLPGVRPNVGNGLPGRPKRATSRAVAQLIGSLLVSQTHPGSEWVALDGGRWDTRLAQLGFLPNYDPVEPLAVRPLQPADTGSPWAAITDDGKYLAALQGISPYMYLYRRDGDVFTRLPNPAQLPTGFSQGGCAFTGDGSYLAISVSPSPYLDIYRRDGDVLTKLPTPAQLPSDRVTCCAFSSDGLYLALGFNDFPYVEVYRRDGDVFTKLPRPATNGLRVNTLSLTANGSHLVLGHTATPFFTVLPRNGDNFTRLPPPAQLPPNVVNGCSFARDGSYLALAHAGAPYVTLYGLQGVTLTKLTGLSGYGIPGAPYACSFDASATLLAVTYEAAPYMSIYRRDGGTLTRVGTSPGAVLSSGGGCVMSADGVYTVVSQRGQYQTPLNVFEGRKPKVAQLVASKATYLKAEQ